MMISNTPNALLPAAFILASVTMLAACSSLSTSIEKSDLEVQTRASESIFLEPVSPAKRVVFVSVRNTSDKDLVIKGRILQRLQASGYRITDDPQAAQFMLQANILKVGKDNQENADSYLEAGITGAAIGDLLASDSNSAEGVVLGAISGVIIDALIEDTLYTMVTDLQVRERPRRSEVVSQQQSSANTQGSGTSITQSSSLDTVEWKTYRTRIVSTANQVNLEFNEALPLLENGLIRSISGLFAE